MENKDEKLMTRDEFNSAVDKWSIAVKDKSLAILVTDTKSYSSRLKSRLKNKLGFDRDTAEAKTVSFKFMRYGVFVAYGVGRGYAVINGTVVRGHKLKEGSAEHLLLFHRGMTKKELSKVKIFDGNGAIKRHPVDWLDPNIENDIEGLADIAGEYYGDASLKHALEQLDRITIKKK